MKTTGLYHAPALRSRPHPADLCPRADLHRADVAQCDQRNRNATRRCAGVSSAGSSTIRPAIPWPTPRCVSARNWRRRRSSTAFRTASCSWATAWAASSRGCRPSTLDRAAWERAAPGIIDKLLDGLPTGRSDAPVADLRRQSERPARRLHLHAASRQRNGHRHDRRDRHAPHLAAGHAHLRR